MRKINSQILLDGCTQIRVHYDEEKNHWIIRINDQEGLVQEFHCDLEPCMMVYMNDKYSEHPVMRKYPTDVIAEYKKGF